MKSKSFLFAAAVLFLCTWPALGTIYFDDGGTHDIDYDIDYVYVDWETPDMYTTVNWLDGARTEGAVACENSRINVSGGHLDDLDTYDSSQANISSGDVEYLCSFDSSRVNVSGGWIYSGIESYNSSQVNFSGGRIGGIYYGGMEFLGMISSYDSSQVNISGGLLLGFISCTDSSQVNISGGSICDDLYCNGSSRLNISGGAIHSINSYQSSHVDISGGEIGWFSSFESSQVNISGGLIYTIQSRDSSQVNIFGGLIDGNLRIGDSSNIRIFGYDFAIDGQPFGYGELTSIYGGWYVDEPLRHLTGTLLNGDLIDNDFYIGEDARMVLIPEPATLLLLGLGGLLSLCRRRN